jgi:phage terminase small subunit
MRNEPVAPRLLTPKQPRGSRAKRKELTPKQSRFVDEYLKDLNAAAAYRRTGYGAKTPSAIWAGACEILRNPNVQVALAVRRTAIEHRTQISQDQVRIELGRVAFFDPRELFDTETGKLIDLPKLPEEVVAAISSVEITHNKDGEKVTKIRFCRKLEALDKLCRHLGMYEDKLRIGGLERELEAMSDEEIERELIELERSDCHRLDASAAGSAAAAAPVLPAA